MSSLAESATQWMKLALPHLKECRSKETSQASLIGRRSKVSSKSDSVVIKVRAAAAQAFAEKRNKGKVQKKS